MVEKRMKTKMDWKNIIVLGMMIGYIVGGLYFINNNEYKNEKEYNSTHKHILKTLDSCIEKVEYMNSEIDTLNYIMVNEPDIFII